MPKGTQARFTKSIIERAMPGQAVWESGVSGFGVRVTPTGVKTSMLYYRVQASRRQGRMTL